MKKKKIKTPNRTTSTTKIVQPTSLKLFSYAILVFLAFIFFKQYENTDSMNDIQDLDDNIFIINFWNGYYQEQIESDLLKNTWTTNLKRIKNKYEYLFFKKVNLDDAYVGKDNYIFGEGMIHSYFGDNYIGENAIKKEVKKAKLVQDKLATLGIQMLLLFAPGKSSIYTEYLPEYILHTKKKINNYQTYIDECHKQNINNIDFVTYFAKIKPISPYPLFSRYGSHWSYYAECIVIDTTIKRLEHLLNINLPNIYYSDIIVEDTSLVRDGDIFRKLNMPIPKGNMMAYPNKIGYEQGIGIVPQKILAIGDSYFRGFFYLGAMEIAFKNSMQWYYYNSIIPEDPKNPEVWELDLMQELKKVKAVVMLMNESNLNTLGNGFVDEAYFMFTNPEEYQKDKMKKNQLNQIKKTIRHNKLLLAQLSRQSIYRGISMDSSITEKAIEILYQQNSNY